MGERDADLCCCFSQKSMTTLKASIRLEGEENDQRKALKEEIQGAEISDSLKKNPLALG